MGRMRKSRLSHYKQDRLTEHFVSKSMARTAASLCGVKRKTTAFLFLRLREIIAYKLEGESEAMCGGEIEVDESYFGGRRGRGAAAKVPVFGYYKGAERFTASSSPTATTLSTAAGIFGTRLNAIGAHSTVFQRSNSGS